MKLCNVDIYVKNNAISMIKKRKHTAERNVTRRENFVIINAKFNAISLIHVLMSLVQQMLKLHVNANGDLNTNSVEPVSYTHLTLPTSDLV